MVVRNSNVKAVVRELAHRLSVVAGPWARRLAVNSARNGAVLADPKDGSRVVPRSFVVPAVVPDSVRKYSVVAGPWARRPVVSSARCGVALAGPKDSSSVALSSKVKDAARHSARPGVVLVDPAHLKAVSNVAVRNSKVKAAAQHSARSIFVVTGNPKARRVADSVRSVAVPVGLTPRKVVSNAAVPARGAEAPAPVAVRRWRSQKIVNQQPAQEQSMRTTKVILISAVAVGVSALAALAQGPDGPPRRQHAEGGGDGQRPPPPPIIAALDANHDGVIDAQEIANASAALKTLDKNGDGKLTMDEIRPQRPEGQGQGQGFQRQGRGPQGGGPQGGGQRGGRPAGPPPAE